MQHIFLAAVQEIAVGVGEFRRYFAPTLSMLIAIAGLAE
jgi:hypothetical protein